MDRPHLCTPERFKVAYERAGQYRRFQQPRKRSDSFKRKGIERWHEAVSTNLVNKMYWSLERSHPVLVTWNFTRASKIRRKICQQQVVVGLFSMLEGTFSNSTSYREKQQRAKVKSQRQLSTTLSRWVVTMEVMTTRKGQVFKRKCEIQQSKSIFNFNPEEKKPLKSHVPYSSKKRPHFPVFKRKKHSMENILQKPDLTVGKLQMQVVDDLIETVTDKSMKLLAQRHAELQHCEFLGDEVLKSSKQFQRMSKRTMRKYKLKNVCFPCTWCCF
ncbi:hypothetical protein E5288_WYG017822 [Bos mutus]|uniref:Uncharacterized protein n=1 Tax=Bos mutus TaxID=72004 RepID=A0A6B0S4B9_9CETA|nr:hypothetical protein [Bos mutus]